MIKSKKKICKECGNEDYIFSKGRCKKCASKSYGSINKTSEKSSAHKNKQVKLNDLTDFFNECIEEYSLNPICEESKAFISNVSRLNCAHIFPKRKYESIMADKDNIILLSWERHTRFDELLDRGYFTNLEIEFPNVWTKVIDRVKILLPKIKEYGNLRFNFEKYLESK